jgi:predicted Zn-dependent peptidase
VTIDLTVLESGLSVVSESMAEVRSVALGFWVGVGARDEPSPEAGASHFLEHLLFKGTPNRSAREIAELVDAVGGEMNAFTAKDHTAFELRVLCDDLEMALDILCEIMWDPAFRPDEVEAERQVILDELLMRGDEPADFVHEVLAEAMFPGHGLGREVLGDVDTVTKMSVDTIRQFHDRHYRPAAMVLAAAGAVDHARLTEGVQRRFAASGGQPGGRRPDRHAPVAPPESLVVAKRPTEQVHLAIGIPALDRHDPDRHALTVLNQVLGGGVASRLFQEVRERLGLAYSVYSYRQSYDDAGVLVVCAGTAPNRARQVLDVMEAELDRLVDGVTARELEVAKGSIIGSMALGLEDSDARMNRIGRSLLLHGDIPSVDDIVARFHAVSRDDLARVAGDLANQPRTLAVVGPVRAADYRAGRR